MLDKSLHMLNATWRTNKAANEGWLLFFLSRHPLSAPNLTYMGDISINMPSILGDLRYIGGHTLYPSLL